MRTFSEPTYPEPDRPGVFVGVMTLGLLVVIGMILYPIVMRYL